MPVLCKQFRQTFSENTHHYVTNAYMYYVTNFMKFPKNNNVNTHFSYKITFKGLLGLSFDFLRSAL